MFRKWRITFRGWNCRPGCSWSAGGYPSITTASKKTKNCWWEFGIISYWKGSCTCLNWASVWSSTMRYSWRCAPSTREWTCWGSPRAPRQSCCSRLSRRGSTSSSNIITSISRGERTPSLRPKFNPYPCSDCLFIFAFLQYYLHMIFIFRS